MHATLDRHGVEYDLTWTLSGGAVHDADRAGWSRRSAARSRPSPGVTPALSTSGGTSDGRFLAAIAREVVEFGPLGEGMHGIDERVSLADIGPLSTIYERTLVALLVG